ncbi:4'-phosphopantetheinyl transferase superfamily, partial [Blyttiomyces helicus]
MLLGIGTDIVHLPRFRTLLSRVSPTRLARRVLAPTEQTDLVAALHLIWASRSVTGVQPLSKRFAIKEAAFKALYPVYHLQWHQVVVSKTQARKPTLQLTPEVAKLCGVRRSLVSVSHDGDYLVAVVVFE